MTVVGSPPRSMSSLALGSLVEMILYILNINEKQGCIGCRFHCFSAVNAVDGGSRGHGYICTVKCYM